MWPRFGIKIGNSTLCIANVKEDGKAEVIANKQGDRVSQACLLWDGFDEIECGLTAKQEIATRPKQGVANSFQLLLPSNKLNAEVVASALKHLSCAYDEQNHTFQLTNTTQSVGDESNRLTRQINPFDVHVRLFQAERELALQYHSGSNHKPVVVISIPSYYPLQTWPILAKCAEEAGFHVAQIISESTAALLAYNIGEVHPSANETHVLTIKSGGLFSHFAVYAIQNGLYTQLAVFGPYAIGGLQYTDVLVKFICEEFQKKYKLDPNESRRTIAKIRSAAENCKHILTSLPTTQLYIDSLMDGIDYSSQMSRARFESLIQPVISNFMQTLNGCLEQAMQKNVNIKKISEIILIGATMQIPKLQVAICARFPEAKLYTTIPTDEVVAVGCARQAIYLTDPEKMDLKVTDDCTFAEEELLIWHGDDEKNAKVLIEKGATLPQTVHVDVKHFKEAKDNSIFFLRAGEQISEVLLKGAEPNSNDIFNIEAEIDVSDVDHFVMPVIRLRCL